MITAIFFFVEILATYLENFLLFCCYDFAFHHKEDYRIIKHLSILGVTAVISLLNHYNLFSYATLVISLVLNSVLASLIYKQKWLSIHRAATLPIAMLYFIVIAVLDLTSVATIGVVLGDSVATQVLLTSLGMFRLVHLFIIKALHVAFYIIAKRMKLYIQPRYINLVGILSFTGLFIIMFLLNELLALNAIEAKIVLIVTCFTMAVGIGISAIVAIHYSQKQLELQKMQILALSRANVENLYTQIITHHQQMDALYHDIKNHMETIRILIAGNKGNEAMKYTAQLESKLNKYAIFCNSGSAALDTVIAHKMGTATKNQIMVNLQVGFIEELSRIDEVDICAIIFNLLDNAIDACMEIPEGVRRFINLYITKRDSRIIIKMENSAKGDPFGVDGTLNSNKEGLHHGIGLASVRSSLEKYKGFLTLECENNVFTATGNLSIPPEDASGNVS